MANLTKLPLSAFDPRCRALLERGCRALVEIPCPSPREAQHLRNMLTTFRAKLRREYKESRDLWEPLYSTIVTVRKERPTVVILRPRLRELDHILGPLDLTLQVEPNLLEEIVTELESEKKDVENK